MKIIKTLVTIAIINAIFVMAVVSYPTQPTPVPLPTIQPSPSTPAQVPSNQVIVTPKPIVNVVPTVAPTIVPTPPSAPTPPPTPRPAGCVIQIDGAKYDITALIRSHSGGNVFTCNTDMSIIFWGRHNQRILQMMQKYRI